MKGLYKFGEFRLDTRKRLLMRAGEPLPLAPKAFDMLVTLLENRDRMMSKDELLEAVWPGTFVEEGNLKFNVSVIRKTLGGESWIETVPRRGYRFAGDVEELSSDSPGDAIVVEAAGMGVRSRTAVSVSLEAELKPPAITTWRVALAAAFVLAIAAGGWLWWRARPRPEVRSMAVLPLLSIASSGVDREMGLGLTDSLIGRLGGEGTWLVRPTASVVAYASGNRDPVAAGRSLSVDAVLDGSIQRSGDRIRLTLQLLRVSDGRHLWTGKFDQKLTDLFSLEDQVAGEVAGALQARLARTNGARSHSASPEVYEAYLAGRTYFNEERPATLQAIRHFEMALERDPNFAPAYGMLALSYWQMSQRGVDPSPEMRAKMRAAAAKAIELDDSRAEGHIAMSLAKMWLDFDWEGSEKEWRRALELGPNEPLAYVAWGIHSIARGRFDETEKAYRKKLELDPRSLMSIEGMSYPYAYRGQLDEAIAWSRKALQVDPNFAIAYNDLSSVYHQKGMHREGVEAALRGAALSGASPERIAERLRLFEEKGIEGFRREELESQLERLRKGQYVSPAAIARSYNALGDHQKALDWLEKAYEARTFQLLFLKAWPPWSTLRGEPRYHELLKKMRLE